MSSYIKLAKNYVKEHPGTTTRDALRAIIFQEEIENLMDKELRTYPALKK